MEFYLRRKKVTDNSTLGSLFWKGEFQCYTLEDRVRLDDPATPEDEGKKVYGDTAIPAGRYQVIVNMSPRLGKLYPRLLKVPGFDGILMHSGNKIADTLGCILLGNVFDASLHPVTKLPIEYHLLDSRTAFSSFFVKLQEELKNSEVWIVITNDFLVKP